MIRVGKMRKSKELSKWGGTASAFALMHGIELFHFTEDKIDLENKAILGEFWDVDKSCFVEKVVSFPHIIDDHRFWPSKKMRRALLKSNVTLTWVDLGDKTKVNEILRGSSVDEYLIDTFDYADVDISEIIEQYNEVIIKPRGARSGKGIYKLSKLNDIYILHNGHEKVELSFQDFSEYDRMFKEGNFIVQEYINSCTKAGNPFDVKVYLIRSGKDGSWNSLQYLPRLGSPLGVVSNVAGNEGGNVLLYTNKFFQEEFGEDWKKVKYEMSKLVVRAPKILQKGYKRTLNTLSLDIGFDKKTNTPKLFEVNGTINSIPSLLKMYAEQVHMHKQLYKEMQGKNKPQNHISVGGNRLYFDSDYNEAFEKTNIRNTKSIVVLGEIAEKDVGQLVINSNIDIVICCDNVTKNISDIIKRQPFTAVFNTTNIEDTSKVLSQIVEPHDTILFKGYHSNGIEIIADKVFGLNLYANVRGKNQREDIIVDDCEADIYFNAKHAIIQKYLGQKGDVQLPSAIKDFSVHSIGKMSFAENEQLKRIVCSSTIVRIDQRAFYECTNLEHIELPKDLRVIGEDAFRGCTQLRKITIPDRVIEIGSKAFAGCVKLEEVRIPSATLSIASDAFEGCNELEVICDRNFYEQKKVQTKGVQFFTNSSEE